MSSHSPPSTHPPSPSASPSTSTRPSKFRFKRSSSTTQSSSQHSKRQKTSSHPSSSSDRHHHRHHHRSHRHQRHRSPSPASQPSPLRTPPLSPDTAFRESLFDALADDEGAAYWEGVYGQPIHTYSRYHHNDYDDEEGGEGEKVDANGNPILERMDDEEYAAFVRRRMWERSHAGLIEERERRERVRKEAREERERERWRDAWEGQKRERRREERERERWRDAWEGQKRERRRKETKSEDEEEEWEMREEEGRWRKGRRKKSEKEKGKEAWAERWKRYEDGWEELARRRREQEEAARTVSGDREETKPSVTTSATATRGIVIPWPTQSGQARDISTETVEAFFRAGAAAGSGKVAAISMDLLASLKVERVRWHPDKMMQRYGSLGIDERRLKYVTSVFQIVDGLWGKVKGDVDARK